MDFDKIHTTEFDKSKVWKSCRLFASRLSKLVVHRLAISCITETANDKLQQA